MTKSTGSLRRGTSLRRSTSKLATSSSVRPRHISTESSFADQGPQGRVESLTTTARPAHHRREWPSTYVVRPRPESPTDSGSQCCYAPAFTANKEELLRKKDAFGSESRSLRHRQNAAHNRVKPSRALRTGRRLCRRCTDQRFEQTASRALPTGTALSILPC